MAVDLSRFRVPAGSLVVDAGLVLALLYGQAQITERLKAFDARMVAVEQSSATVSAESRLKVLVRENVIQDRDFIEFKGDIVKRLDQMDSKLDLIYRAQGAHRER